MYYGPHISPCIPGVDWETRCSACDGECRIVPGDGPLDARLFLIGDRSGPDEIRSNKRPFTAKTGREMNENYLYLAGTCRDEVYFTNTVKCPSPKGQAPGKPLIQSCSQHFLQQELDMVRPTFVVPMGSTACSLFDNIYLKTHHGMPLKRSLFGRTYWVLPQFHPAGGLRDTKQMSHALEDWERMRSIIDGEFQIPIDRHKTTDYRLVSGRRGVDEYLTPFLSDIFIPFGGLDTETDEGNVWCITLSVKPGTGIMILRSDYEAVAAFKDLCDRFRWFVHNALFDISKLYDMGIYLKHVTCTMQAAYHRGSLPQGLKQLAWRLLGITMTEYEDVVIPQSKKKLMSWWQDALVTLDSDATITPRFHKKSGKELKPDIKSTKMFSRMMFVYNKGQTDSETYDMWKMWDLITETAGITRDDKQRLLDRIGPPPSPSIIHVQMEDSIGVTGAKTYAIRDADAVLRLGLFLRSQEREIRQSMKRRPVY